ncbi:hypothetical protein DXG01_014206 [Tephrocybe rancida]|nr:hypothetical protein DXG01_014206 [Tephrocybe rancida]
MSDTVFLEDIETSSARVAPTNDDGPPSSPAGPSAESTPTITKPGTQGSGVKRQRTLMDMLSGSQGKTVSREPSAKKLKLTASGASNSSSSALVSRGSRSGMQKLNSIPFSMSVYQETLTEEQKGLLRLECEVMGKSWLKVLKEEIKKPYFIALKKFLWEEGVKGPDDSSPKLRIYPARKCLL